MEIVQFVILYTPPRSILIFENIKKNSNRHKNNNLNGHTNNKKTKRSTCKKISLIEDNINKFKNNKISRLDFVKIIAFEHQPI